MASLSESQARCTEAAEDTLARQTENCTCTCLHFWLQGMTTCVRHFGHRNEPGPKAFSALIDGEPTMSPWQLRRPEDTLKKVTTRLRGMYTHRSDVTKPA